MDTTDYEIRVKSHLGPSSVTAFGGWCMRHETNGETTLYGPAIDQAALHGVLILIRDLGLELVEVKRITGRAKSL